MTKFFKSYQLDPHLNLSRIWVKKCYFILFYIQKEQIDKFSIQKHHFLNFHIPKDPNKESF